MKITVTRQTDKESITMHVFVFWKKGSYEWKDRVFWDVVNKLIKKGWLSPVATMHNQWSDDNLTCQMHSYYYGDASEGYDRYHSYNHMSFTVVN